MSSTPIESRRLDEQAAEDLPSVSLPRAPRAALLWSRALLVASALVTLFTLDLVTVLLGHYWLLESLGFSSVFWTNFGMGAKLYAGVFLLYTAAIAAPAFANRAGPAARRFALRSALLLASVAALLAAMRYQEFLLGSSGGSFGKADPVFGNDIGFYVFALPNIWIAWRFLMGAAILMLVSSVVSASAARGRLLADPRWSRLALWLAKVSTKATRAAWAFCGTLTAVGIWLTRYDLLGKDNSKSSIKRGAEYLDVTGFFSNLHYIAVTAFVALGVTAAVWVALSLLRRAATRTRPGEWRRTARRALATAVLLVLADFAFKAAVVARDVTQVRPNEPVVQLPFIQRHIDATRTAYGLDKIQGVEFVPNGPGDPLPSAETLLQSPTFKNAPLWPGFVSYLERWLDKQHAQRIVQTKGNTMVYGPTLELFQQQQKLRTYYNILNVDNVRYTVDGEKRMFVSGVRETPLFEPVPWLAYWGQRFMLFTHGYGLVMAPTAETNARGEPVYIARDIPVRAEWPEIRVENPRVYYGEGSATMAFSNVDRMKELDYPTDQDRAETVLPAEVKSGVLVDSFVKRLVFGWRSGKFLDLVFSDLIKDSTRVHYYRTPVDRLAQAAPFLFYDSNPYAVSAGGRIVWMVNAMTTADRYPYSLHEEIGDKSDERSPFPRPERLVNYIEDSVKATVDSYTGQVRLYKMKEAPVVNAWARIYPELFAPAASMPADVARQLTYPTQLFHIQFDDIAITYQMKDAMYFFNMEDMWDDGDEVLGPILDTGKAITFSMEPYIWMAETGGSLPASREKTQYALAMAFTPEKALNLRAISIAYQDPPDYGKLAVLQIPKGRYVIGPEQADAAIDQEPEISQQFSWWNRRGTEVIRGHTTLLIVGKEVLYVEPIFLRSEQNPLPQLKKVIVVLRGRPFMGEDLEDAVRRAVAGQSVSEGGDRIALKAAEAEPAEAAPAALR